MIDTLILRIKGVRKYQHLIRSLDPLNQKGYSTETAMVQQGEIAKLITQGIKPGKEVIDMIKLHRTGDFLLRSKVGKQVNASNHYSFAYHINYSADHLEFNFSIPKYVYGSNIILFVDNPWDRDFTFSDCSLVDYNIEKSFLLFQRFIDYFFRMEFAHSEVDFKDVEVHRIDVCFNQVFPTKLEALRYLEYQKRLKKKYAREEEGVLREYGTSLMYVTKRYSAKIYHKGTEYTKHDLKEHLKINKERKRQYFKTEEFQKFSDRILRYELTIRTQMLNYLHKKYIFRRNCPDFKLYYKEYLKVENIIQRNNRISKKAGTLPEAEKEAYLKQYPYESIDRESKKIHKWVSKVTTSRTFFTLEIDEEAKLYNKRTAPYECNRALFSKGLLKLCLKKLMHFTKEFQIAELPEEDKVQKLVGYYNREHRSKIPASEMMWFYKQLATIGSFKETAKYNNLSRATLFRYKQRFKKIGITEQNIRPVTDDGVPEAPLDLREYHTELLYNPYLNKNNNPFQL